MGQGMSGEARWLARIWPPATASQGAPPVTEKSESSYAMSIADGSFAWYRTAAIRARRLHHSAEISRNRVAGEFRTVAGWSGNRM